jgi:hypothetical protein
MAEQPPVPADVTPEQFFEELLPMGFEAQAAAGGTAPSDVSLQFHLTGNGGGDWNADNRGGRCRGGAAPTRTSRSRSPSIGAMPCSAATAPRSP